MDPVAAEQPAQQQEHIVVLEEQVVLLGDHDEGVEDYDDFPHNYDNPLDVQPISPPIALEMEGDNVDLANNRPDHPNKSKIMHEFEQYIEDSRKRPSRAQHWQIGVN
jgi:hypothetical protein